MKLKPATSYEGHLQDPPALGNQYEDDAILRAILRLYIPADRMQSIVHPDLHRFGDVVVTEQMMDWVRDAEENLPRVVHFDAWGKRIDKLITAEGWRAMRSVAAREGVISIAYTERGQDRLAHNARVYQFAKYYMYSPSSALYTCPLAMSDGGARLIELAKDSYLMEHAYPRLTSRDPATFWTSGQWMSERPGGSDVANTETLAVPPADGSNNWSISGFKFFSSGTDSDMTFLLARQGQPTKTGEMDFNPGSKGLSLFMAELRKPNGQLNGIRIQRLKNKLGTKAVPTAELELTNMSARLVGQPHRGVATIATILNITRIHCAVGSCSFLRRALATARDYAYRRTAFGKTIRDHPLHARLLSDADVALRGCMELTFYLVHLLGITEVQERMAAGVLPRAPLPEDARTANELLRLLTPAAKMFTANECVRQIGLCMEGLGGQGYMEDAAGIPRLWRDAQVNTIWEGTGAVMAHDVVRVLKQKGMGAKAWAAFEERVKAFVTLPSTLASEHDLAKSRAVLLKSLEAIRRHVMAVQAPTPKGVSKDIEVRIEQALESTWKTLAWSFAEVMAGALLVRHAKVLLETSPGTLDAKQHVAAAARWCLGTTTFPGHGELACADIVDAVLDRRAHTLVSGSDNLLAFGIEDKAVEPRESPRGVRVAVEPVQYSAKSKI